MTLRTKPSLSVPRTAASWLRRVVGVALVALVVLPVYRLLVGREVGLAGATVVAYADLARSMLWLGTAIVAGIAVVLGRVIEPGGAERRTSALGARLAAIPISAFALALALLTTAATAWFSRAVLEARPNLVDGMVQLQQARYVAAGHLAGPAGPLSAFWQIQNSIVTPNGWVSQYPPGHVVLLGLGLVLGAAWMVGPVLAGIAVFFAALAAERLLPADRAVARVGALLAAGAPLAIAHAGSYMNHVTASACGALAVYAALRARDGRAAWAVLAGAAGGAAFTVRPLAAIMIGVIVLLTWTLAPDPSPATASRASSRQGVRHLGARVGLALLGAVPFGLAVAAYNAHFFGDALRFGYVAAYGPGVGLGFRRDPWGNQYGLVEAIAYTSSDLTALSLNLLEAPMPVAVVVGLFLLIVARPLAAGERVIACWALLPVLSNVFYWHHGIFMGPRMMAESAPAWALLTAVAAAALVRRAARQVQVGGVPYSPRVAVGSAFVLAWALGVAYLAPDRLRSYGGPWMASARRVLPEPAEPALVFVHGAWTGRIGAELQGAGVRLDSLETLLRQNSACEAQHYRDAYVAPRLRGTTAVPLPPADLAPRAGTPGGLDRVDVSPGSRINVRRGVRLSPDCLREVAADTSGALDVAPHLWQHDLPGLPARGTMFVRDLGPARNAELIAAYPSRRPLALLQRASDDVVTLVPYEDAMRALYSTPSGGAPTRAGVGMR
jgi:hypothetical protein